MPEIAEVYRLTHFLREHLVGKKIHKVVAADDPILFGKVGTTAEAFAKALTGRKVQSASNQGKYFWLVLDKPPHPVMHLGMTGWIHFKTAKSATSSYYKAQKSDDKNLWPPRFCKFQLETSGKDKVELAFTDPRRLGRVRIVDCPGSEIKNYPPLVNNGPDPVHDVKIFTEQFFFDLIRRKKVPIKSLLLDQANISGIGNWVADEVLYQAKIHPEQYSNDLSDGQIKALYTAIRNVCQTACDVLADSKQFPPHWLFLYRWGKGKKTAGKLPNGEALEFVTVGGRTSCYCPTQQKLSRATELPPSSRKRKFEDSEVEQDDQEVKAEDEKTVPKTKISRRRVKVSTNPQKESELQHLEEENPSITSGATIVQVVEAPDAPSKRSRKKNTPKQSSKTTKSTKAAKTEEVNSDVPHESGLRRSKRLVKSR